MPRQSRAPRFPQSWRSFVIISSLPIILTLRPDTPHLGFGFFSLPTLSNVPDFFFSPLHMSMWALGIYFEALWISSFFDFLNPFLPCLLFMQNDGLYFSRIFFLKKIRKFQKYGLKPEKFQKLRYLVVKPPDIDTTH